MKLLPQKIIVNIMTKIFFLAVFSLLLASCKSMVVRGQYVDDKTIENINSGKFNKEEISEMIGTPTYVPEYNDDTWYYLQRSMSSRAWFEPRVDEQRIVKISFDSQNVVKEAVLIKDSQNENLSLQAQSTESRGSEQNGLQKFVKNVGRFNKTTDGARKKKKKK